MTLYAIAVFVHVTSAMGIFVAMGIEWVIVAHVVRVESAEEAQEWLGLLEVIRRLSPVSMATLLISGVYMMAVTWGGAGWIIVGFVALLLLPPLGMINLLRLPTIARDLAGQRGPLSPELRQRLHDPLFVASIQIRTAIALGIVYLMTTRPDAAGSVVAIGMAIVVGVAFSFPALSRVRVNRSRPVGRSAG
jgi:hypothetical protein